MLVILNMSTYSKDDRTNANAISTSNTPDNIQQSKKTSQLQTRRLRPRVHHPNRMVEYDRHHTDGTHASQTKGMGEGLREKTNGATSRKQEKPGKWNGSSPL